MEIWRDYDDHYLLIAARPGTGAAPPLAGERAARGARPPRSRASPRARSPTARAGATALERLHRAGQQVVLWGGGSKAVAFLTTLGITDEIDYVVDINPQPPGTFIAGSGQQIVAPAFLADYRPDVVVIMSPVYLPEITADLQRLGVRPKHLLTVETPEQLAAA